MTGCSAIGCSNSSVKGFTMKYFPKDPTRRKLWASKMRRENWKPTDRSVLCEVHFEAHMWEKPRVDGKKKLKHDAVPTLFKFTAPPRHRKLPKERFPSVSLKATQNRKTPSPTTTDMYYNLPSTSFASDSTDMEFVIESESIDKNSTADKIALQKKLQYYQKQFKLLNAKCNKYKNCVRNSNRRVRILKEKLEKREEDRNTKLLKSVFNDDQVISMKRKSTKFMKWSNATLQKALKLKFSCGSNGYEELIKQKHPLPSVRTLQRHLQNLKFESGVLYEVFQFK